MKRFMGKDMQNREDILKNDLPNLVLIGILFVLATSSIATADWADGLWGLLTIALIGIVVGYFITTSSFAPGFAFLMDSAYGILVVGAQIARLVPQEFPLIERLSSAYDRVVRWVEVVARGEASDDTLVFVIFLGVLFWYLSYGAVRNFFRHQRLWRTILPAGVALIVNVYYYRNPSEMGLWVIAYLFFSFVLVTRTTAITREGFWRSKRVGFTPEVRTNLVSAGVIAAVALIVLAWAAPPVSASSQITSVWERASDWARVRDTWNRLFGSLRGGRVTVADYYGGARLRLGGPVNLSDRPVMTITARQGPRYYWRSRLFDTYEDGSWTGVGAWEISDEYGALPHEEESYLLRENVHQAFELNTGASRLVYVASQPMSVTVPVRVEVDYTDEGRGLGTPVVIYADGVLISGDTYNVISSISAASENDLRSAGTGYPAWVRERYLQLPSDVTQRTRDLAAEIAAPYDNPYDVATAIERYLRGEITYNEQISPPPLSVDPVDYLLFDSHQGYCVYTASAMAVMLRTQGIPARLAAGFAQGIAESQDDSTQADVYVVNELDAHTWVEVYFPSYGWIEFEPTAREVPIQRPNSAAIDESGGTVEEEEERERLLGEQPGLGAEERDREFDTADIGAQPLAGRLVRIFRVVIGILIGAGVLAGGAFGALYWAEHRGLRHLSEISRAYAHLNLYASWMRMNFAPGATPYERGRELAVEVPEGRETIRQVVDLYVMEQYSPTRLATGETDEARAVAHSWRSIRPAFLRRVIRRRLAKYWSSQ
jgi:transglutaminase-like putative cysteine protease